MIRSARLYFSHITFLACATLAAGFAQNITDFGEGPVTGISTWTYNGSTSTLSGPNANGNELLGTMTPTDFSGSNTITLTATADIYPGSSFLFTLFDQSAGSMSAVFTWSQMDGTAQTASLTPLLPGTMQNVNVWRILSIYDGGSPLSFNVTFSSATASYQTPAPSGIGGPVLTTFGSSAASSGNWVFDQASNHLSGTPAFGDSVSGNTPLTNYSGATQVSLTASAAGATSAPFTYVVTDAEGDQAYAAFDWSSFSGGTATVTSDLVASDFFDPTSVQSWSILSGSSVVGVNATLFGAGLVSPSKSETELDNFGVSVGPVFAGGGNQTTASSSLSIDGWASAERALQVSAGAASEVDAQISGGIFGGAATGGDDPSILLSYSDFEIYAPEQQFLRLDFLETNNLDLVAVVLGSTNSQLAVNGIFSIADGETQTLFIDMATMCSGEGIDAASFLAGLNSISIGFASSAPTYFFQLDNISISAIPEPSAAVLAILAVGAICLARSRFRA